jgi:hypothetical protein
MQRYILDFADDQVGVPDEALLYRRVDWDKIGGRSRCPVGETGKINGNCFTDYPLDRATAMGYPGPCMSVGVDVVLKEHGQKAAKLLEKCEGYGLACVTAGDLRRLTRPDGSPCPQGVMLSPTEVEPWHGVVFDITDGQRKTSVCKAIARIAKWAIPLVNELPACSP